MGYVVVLGATGHIGAYTIEYLKQALNPRFFSLVASGRRDCDWFTKNKYSYCKVDICKEEDFDSLPRENVDAVVHLAGIMPASMKGYDPRKYVDVNVRGSLNVLEYCRRVGCKRIIVTHTESDLSGYWKPGAVVDPDLPPLYDRGTNYAMYISSRLAVVEMLRIYQAQYGIIPYIIRCSTVYCFTESPYMYKLGKRIIPGYRQIYEKACKGDPIEIWGNPKVKTDIVYVKDFAQIVEKAILSDDGEGGFFNIGTGMPVSLEEQVRIAVEVFSEKGKVSPVSYRPDKPDGRDFTMDITKTKRVLGYSPRYDYRSYLEDYKIEMAKNRFRGLFTPRDEA